LLAALRAVQLLVLFNDWRDASRACTATQRVAVRRALLRIASNPGDS